MNMSFIDEGIIYALRRILEYMQSGNMSDSLAIIIGICSYKVTEGEDILFVSQTSWRFLVLGLMVTVGYAVYQLWFGAGLDKLKSDAEYVYQTRKLPLAAVLGGPELYIAVVAFITATAQFILGSTNVLLIFKLATINNPVAIFLQFILSIPFAIAAYVYKWVLDNGYYLFRPLGIFLLFFPKNGLANKAFRIIGYNMLYPLVICLMLYTIDNTARHGGALSSVAWVSIPFFSYVCYLALKYLYKYAWDPEKTKQWFEDTVKEAPGKAKNYASNKAFGLYRSVLRKIRTDKKAPVSDNMPSQPAAAVPQAPPDIQTRK